MIQLHVRLGKMKLLLTPFLALIIFCSHGHSYEPVNEFHVREGQSVSETFEDLMAAHRGEEAFQILVTPKIAGDKMKEIKLRNLTFGRCVQFICERNKLSYIQKGPLFVVTGGQEVNTIIDKQLNQSPLPTKERRVYRTERRGISQMPVIGERPEFGMVWEMKKELEELRKRLATLEKNEANQSE